MSKPVQKKLLARVFEIGFWVAIGAVLIIRAPQWMSSFQMHGKAAPQIAVTAIPTGEKVTLPLASLAGKNHILVFWATWCGPCHIEMARLSRAVREGQIDGRRILAIDVAESLETVKAYLIRTPYPFDIFLDENSQAADAYKVGGTPTVVFVDGDGKMKWVTVGMSPLLIWRAKQHLR